MHPWILLEEFTYRSDELRRRFRCPAKQASLQKVMISGQAFVAPLYAGVHEGVSRRKIIASDGSSERPIEAETGAKIAEFDP
jgi:hypothetical protein